MSFRVINGKICPIEPIGSYNSNVGTNKIKQNSNFANILNEKIKGNDSFVFSAHAAQRLKDRNIIFNDNDMKTINEGINKAQGKGCRESVIFYKGTVLVTSIKNITIITVLDENSIKGNVFTNVDSVVTL